MLFVLILRLVFSVFSNSRSFSLTSLNPHDSLKEGRNEFPYPLSLFTIFLSLFFYLLQQKNTYTFLLFLYHHSIELSHKTQKIKFFSLTANRTLFLLGFPFLFLLPFLSFFSFFVINSASKCSNQKTRYESD